MIQEITKSQLFQVVGLLTLAATSREQLAEIEEALKTVLQVEEKDSEVSGVGDPDHIVDACYCNYSADFLLKNLGIRKL